MASRILQAQPVISSANHQSFYEKYRGYSKRIGTLTPVSGDRDRSN